LRGSARHHRRSRRQQGGIGSILLGRFILYLIGHYLLHLIGAA
jgi:hypothetical protein